MTWLLLFFLLLVLARSRTPDLGVVNVACVGTAHMLVWYHRSMSEGRLLTVPQLADLPQDLTDAHQSKRSHGDPSHGYAQSQWLPLAASASRQIAGARGNWRWVGSCRQFTQDDAEEESRW